MWTKTKIEMTVILKNTTRFCEKNIIRDNSMINGTYSAANYVKIFNTIIALKIACFNILR